MMTQTTTPVVEALQSARALMQPAAFDALALVSVARRMAADLAVTAAEPDPDNLLNEAHRLEVLLRLAEEQIRVGLRAFGKVPG